MTAVLLAVWDRTVDAKGNVIYRVDFKASNNKIYNYLATFPAEPSPTDLYSSIIGFQNQAINQAILDEENV